MGPEKKKVKPAAVAEPQLKRDASLKNQIGRALKQETEKKQQQIITQAAEKKIPVLRRRKPSATPKNALSNNPGKDKSGNVFPQKTDTSPVKKGRKLRPISAAPAQQAQQARGRQNTRPPSQSPYQKKRPPQNPADQQVKPNEEGEYTGSQTTTANLAGFSSSQRSRPAPNT